MFFRSLESPVQQVSMGLSGILKIDVRRRYRKILACQDVLCVIFGLVIQGKTERLDIWQQVI